MNNFIEEKENLKKKYQAEVDSRDRKYMEDLLHRFKKLKRAEHMDFQLSDNQITIISKEPTTYHGGQKTRSYYETPFNRIISKDNVLYSSSYYNEDNLLEIKVSIKKN